MSVMISSTQRTRRTPIEMAPKADLTTDRLVFRPLGYADQDAFLGALERSRASVRRWFPLERKGESSEAYFTRMVDLGVTSDQSHDAWRRGVFTDDGVFVGVANLIKIERGLAWSAEINTWIDETHRGKGYGREIVGHVTDHALGDLHMGMGLHEVRALVCLDNTPSKSLFTSLGYIQTGETDLFEVNEAVIRHHVFTRRAG